MIYILFLWIAGKQPAITNQEFASHQDCINAALAFRRQFGPDAQFMCIKKGTGEVKKGK